MKTIELGNVKQFCDAAASIVRRASDDGRGWLTDDEHEEMFAVADRIGVAMPNRRRALFAEAKRQGLADYAADRFIEQTFLEERVAFARREAELLAQRAAEARAQKRGRREETADL